MSNFRYSQQSEDSGGVSITKVIGLIGVLSILAYLGVSIFASSGVISHGFIKQEAVKLVTKAGQLSVAIEFYFQNNSKVVSTMGLKSLNDIPAQFVCESTNKRHCIPFKYKDGFPKPDSFATQSDFFEVTNFKEIVIPLNGKYNFLVCSEINAQAGAGERSDLTFEQVYKYPFGCYNNQLDLFFIYKG